MQILEQQIDPAIKSGRADGSRLAAAMQVNRRQAEFELNRAVASLIIDQIPTRQDEAQRFGNAEAFSDACQEFLDTDLATKTERLTDIVSHIVAARRNFPGNGATENTVIVRWAGSTGQVLTEQEADELETLVLQLQGAASA
jgi:hypothetical protein